MVPAEGCLFLYFLRQTFGGKKNFKNSLLPILDMKLPIMGLHNFFQLSKSDQTDYMSAYRGNPIKVVRASYGLRSD